MSTALRTGASWYDYPQYYDLAFRDQTATEARFVEAACRRFAAGRVERLFEPACGSGRSLAALAARGYQMIGLDLNPAALGYAGRRLRRRGLSAELILGDMADFSLPRPADSAYCLLNSFRHLLSEEAARGHLRAMARAVRPGGVYLLGFHLLPPDASLESTERWTVVRGRTRLTVTLRVTEADRRTRIERLRMTSTIEGPRGRLRLRDEFPLRMYNARQVRQLFAAVPEWHLCEVYDFWCDIDDPRPFDNELADAIFVLRRR